jgi:hypothetical protein
MAPSEKLELTFICLYGVLWAEIAQSYSDLLRAERCGTRIPVGAIFFIVQTGTEAHPASYTVGAGISEGKTAGP